VFVQNAFLIVDQHCDTIDYREWNYERALVPMPHLGEIVRRHHHPVVHEIPYALPSYAFMDRTANHVREKLILLYPKRDTYDYRIAKSLLAFSLKCRMSWRMAELRGYTHREALALMKRAFCLVNVNCYEAFNTTVPEAMAAGCLCFCYRAFGGIDFLIDNGNAYVYENNDVYGLLQRVLFVIDNCDGMSGEVAAIRQQAFTTASMYGESAAAERLGTFYRRLLQ
jgi:glycosyltransferase involved in cell wall biosynthesis